MDEIDSVVIGAGVIGLAVARAFALAGREVLILEQATAFGTGISSRNSEVIHAGIHYPEGSLKARLCVEGKVKLYDYCAGRDIPHRRCGKLIVATTSAQIGELEAIERHARANGVDDLTWLDAADARRLEPELSCVRVLRSPSTGIIDSHALMLSLLGEAEAAGAMIAYGTPVARMALDHHGTAIWTGNDAEPSLRARLVVNAAGLAAFDLARRIEGFPAAHIPKGWFAKGSYFALAGRSPFSRLIYPIPEPGGLGIHLTLDLGGQARFGPDVEWVDQCDFAVDPLRGARFYDAIRAYWPGLPDGALIPAYSGIRPKLSGPADPAADFHIGTPAVHGVAGIVNLFGIESPGLTASLAIAEAVVRDIL
jgi:L-2-hydroxyglutarate oxidase LhgO